MVRELMQYRYLIVMFTVKELKIRYKQSVMGFGWALLMPSLIVLAGFLMQKVFSVMAGRSVNSADVVAVSVKALPWAFFIGSVRFGTASLAGNASLITRIYFPREVFPLSSVLAHLVDLGVAAGVLVIVLTVVGIGASVQLLWLPLLLATLILLTAGCTMFLACANLFFRDVKYIVEIFLMFGIFFTPVFYDAHALGRWSWVALVNPVGAVLDAIGAVVVHHQAPDPFWVAYAVTWAVVGFLTAWLIFDRAEYAFAEFV